MSQGVETILMLVLGAGGATFIWTVVRSYLAVKVSAETREAKAIQNLEKWRLDADARADRAIHELSFARRMANYWQTRAAQLEFLCRRNGIEVPPPDPEPVAVPFPTGDDPAHA